jgi:hypothetical protein
MFYMVFVHLFLSLFRFCVFLLSSRSGALPKIALVWLENQHFRRYFKQHGIRPRLLLHEKQLVHEFATQTKSPSRFFSLVSPKTVLSSWKNAVALDAQQAFPRQAAALLRRQKPHPYTQTGKLSMGYAAYT